MVWTAWRRRARSSRHKGRRAPAQYTLRQRTPAANAPAGAIHGLDGYSLFSAASNDRAATSASNW